jgi:hypothetical protein
MGRQKDFGVPAGRFLALSLETNQPGPYVITDKLSVTAPTKKRRDQMRDSQAAVMVNNALLSQALQAGANTEVLTELTAGVRTAEQDYNRAFLGEQCDDIMAFFDGQPTVLWDAFVVDVKKHFVPSQPADELDDGSDSAGKPLSS